MLKYRLIFGPLLIALLLGVLWADAAVDLLPSPEWLRRVYNEPTLPPGVVILIAGAVVSFLAAAELSRILHDKGVLASKRMMCAAALSGLAVSCLIPSHVGAMTAVAAVNTAAVFVLLLSLAFYSRHKSFEGVVAAAGGTLLAFVYLGIMLGFFLAIRREHSVLVLLWVFLTTKSCDIGAYFTGRAIGRHKLILWLSPGKTWEGFWGGVALSAVVGWGGAVLLQRLGVSPAPGPIGGLVAGALFGIVGQAGDLIASLFKRDAGLKDSSRIVPGFGGVLDVLDSLLLVAPVAYWWLSMKAVSG